MPVVAGRIRKRASRRLDDGAVLRGHRQPSNPARSQRIAGDQTSYHVGGRLRAQPPDVRLLTGHRHPSHSRDLLHLQRSAGNQAVLRYIQRLPSVALVKERMGKTKRSYRISHGSTKYKAILDALGDYNDHVSTKFDPLNFVVQLKIALTKLAALQTAVAAYAGKGGKKADYFTGELARGIAKERSLISQAGLSVKLKMPSTLGAPTIAGVMLKYFSGGPRVMDEAKVSGTDRGGSSEVTKFSLGGSTSFFKETKQKLHNVPAAEETSEQASDNALQNEKNLGVGVLGIDPNDAHMANRDVAMYRLDQLLGGDLIAKAELVKRELPSGVTVTGSLMEGAQGRSSKDILKAKQVGDDATDQASRGPGAISMKDPTFMRLLSRLQLIDLLAMQIDRNAGNFFIQTDTNGNVTGITGIDNDFALGTEDSIGRFQQQLPGFSRYVDKDMAEKIFALDLGLVEIVMADLLSPPEIQALLARFGKVKAHLGKVGTQLLTPGQWDDAVSKGLLDENSSYYSEVAQNKSKIG